MGMNQWTGNPVIIAATAKVNTKPTSLVTARPPRALVITIAAIITTTALALMENVLLLLLLLLGKPLLGKLLLGDQHQRQSGKTMITTGIKNRNLKSVVVLVMPTSSSSKQSLKKQRKSGSGEVMEVMPRAKPRPTPASEKVIPQKDMASLKTPPLLSEDPCEKKNANLNANPQQDLNPKLLVAVTEEQPSKSRR